MTTDKEYQQQIETGRFNVSVVQVKGELDRATEMFDRFNSTHEGYAVLKEEVDELWEAVKKNDIQAARMEAYQVAAMAIRFLLDTEHML